MNIEELKKEKVEIQYSMVKGKAQRHHVEAVLQSGISEERVIEEAFKEVYEQLVRRGAISNITPKTVQREIIPKQVRGEYTTKGIKEEILSYIKQHPGCSGKEIEDNIPGMGHNSIYSHLDKMKTMGLITRRSRGDNAKDGIGCYVVNQEEELEAMIPTGTKVNMMG